MSPITHFLTGWVVANSSPSLSVRERALVTLASIAPDLDGLGVVAEVLTRNSSHPLLWFSLYHHQLHNLAFALVVSGICALLAKHRAITGLMAFLSFHLHLIEDLVGARGPDGYRWPIPYLAPFSQCFQLEWTGQWALNAWPNFVLTLILLILAFYLALRTGHSPLEMVSANANKVFVATVAGWFTRKADRKS